MFVKLDNHWPVFIGIDWNKQKIVEMTSYCDIPNIAIIMPCTKGNEIHGILVEILEKNYIESFLRA